MDRYLKYTRAPWACFLFSLPLAALYHLVALVANMGSRSGVINGADALIQNGLSMLGVHGWLGGTLLLALIIGIFAYRSDPAHRNGRIRWDYFGAMLGESAVYAVLFGGVVAFLTSHLVPHGGFLQMGRGVSWGQNLAAGLGAGLYEELVFRAGLCGGMIWALQKMSVKHAPAAIISVLVSSFLFSLFHYVGAYGEPFQIYSFMFRFIAGLVLAGIFAVRGFAVAAWTHSLYDVFLLLFGR